MYKRILDADWIKVDYYNDGKPMIRVSEFIKGKWIDHFAELPGEVRPDWYERLSNLDYEYSPVKDGEPWYRVKDVWACIEEVAE